MREQKSFRNWFLDSLRDESKKEKSETAEQLELRIKQNNWAWISILVLFGVYVVGLIIPFVFLKNTILHDYRPVIAIFSTVAFMGMFFFCSLKQDYYHDLIKELEPKE